MKDYKQFIKQLPSSTIVCALGEFNPPTTTHELLIKTVQVVAEQKKADHIVFTAPSNTLQEDKKHNFLKLMFPKSNFISIGESFFSTVVKKLNEKYKHVIVIAGADQFDEFKNLKESNIQIISIGQKDPDADAAKMKQCATKGIYEDFKKLLPSTIREIDGKRLMNEMRIGMELEPIKEKIVLVKDDLREQYFRGEIFNVGQIVESDGVQYEIVKRGSNHLLLKNESGELVSKWITAVNEAVIQPNGTDKIDPNAPEQQGNNQVQKPKGKVKGFLTFYNYDDKTKSVNEDVETDYCPECMENPCVCGGNHLEEAKKKKEKVDPVQDRPGMGTETKPFNDPFFSEEEIDAMMDDLTEEELLGLDEHDEWDLVYEDTGEIIPPHPDEAQIDLMEVLSRQERMRGKIRLRRTQAKRERTTKINTHRYANPVTVNKRARRLAIKLIKKRMLRGRNPAKVSVGDKERIEKALSKNKQLIDRVAQKLVVRVRKVEKARMSKGKTQKGNMPSVF